MAPMVLKQEKLYDWNCINNYRFLTEILHISYPENTTFLFITNIWLCLILRSELMVRLVVICIGWKLHSFVILYSVYVC